MARNPYKNPIESLRTNVSRTQELTGYRPLTAAEHRRLGVSPSKRLYTKQKPGVKKLDISKTAPRRRVEQEALSSQAGRKVTNERKAYDLFVTRGLRTPSERSNQALEQFVKHAPKHVREKFTLNKNGTISKRSVQHTEEYKAFLKALKSRPKRADKKQAKLEALAIYYADEDYERFKELAAKYLTAT